MRLITLPLLALCLTALFSFSAYATDDPLLKKGFKAISEKDSKSFRQVLDKTTSDDFKEDIAIIENTYSRRTWWTLKAVVENNDEILDVLKKRDEKLMDQPVSQAESSTTLRMLVLIETAVAGRFEEFKKQIEDKPDILAAKTTITYEDLTSCLASLLLIAAACEVNEHIEFEAVKVKDDKETSGASAKNIGDKLKIIQFLQDNAAQSLDTQIAIKDANPTSSFACALVAATQCRYIPIVKHILTARSATLDERCYSEGTKVDILTFLLLLTKDEDLLEIIKAVVDVKGNDVLRREITTKENTFTIAEIMLENITPENHHELLMLIPIDVLKQPSSMFGKTALTIAGLALTKANDTKSLDFLVTEVGDHVLNESFQDKGEKTKGTVIQASFIYALKYGYKDVAEELVKKDSNFITTQFTYKGNTATVAQLALIHSTQKNQIKSIHYLMDLIGDLLDQEMTYDQHKGTAGNIALIIAAMEGHLELLTLVAEKRPEFLNQEITYAENTYKVAQVALIKTAYYYEEGHKSTLEYLLNNMQNMLDLNIEKHYISQNLPSVSGKTIAIALLEATHGYALEAIRMIVEKYPDSSSLWSQEVHKGILPFTLSRLALLTAAGAGGDSIAIIHYFRNHVKEDVLTIPDIIDGKPFPVAIASAAVLSDNIEVFDHILQAERKPLSDTITYKGNPYPILSEFIVYAANRTSSKVFRRILSHVNNNVSQLSCTIKFGNKKRNYEGQAATIALLFSVNDEIFQALLEILGTNILDSIVTDTINKKKVTVRNSLTEEQRRWAGIPATVTAE